MQYKNCQSIGESCVFGGRFLNFGKCINSDHEVLSSELKNVNH